jgi:hypothetical protein
VRPKHVETTITKSTKEIVALDSVYSESRYTHNVMQTPRVKDTKTLQSHEVIISTAYIKDSQRPKGGSHYVNAPVGQHII